MDIGGDMGKEMLRDRVLFYGSFLQAVEELPKNLQSETLFAILRYGIYGEEPKNLKRMSQIVFGMAKPILDANIVRRENAKKGGAPKGLCNNPNGRRGNKSETNQEQTENIPRTNQEQTENKPNIFIEKENKEEEIKNKEIELSNDNPKKKNFDLSFVSSEYMEAFQEWLDYKKARKETYQTQMGVKKCYSHLLKLCKGNPAVAKQIVDQSIANNWAGLFELKTPGKVSAHPTGESGSNGLKLGKGERFENGRRTYGTGIANIPLNAPPRPSEQYFWNADNQQWAIA